MEFLEGEDKEIDEFVAAHLKYHRGEPTAGVTTWYFSVYGRTSHNFRCFYVIEHSREELQPLINRFCKIGDTVFSDGLKSYFNLSETMIHKVVNHSEGFVDPDDHNINTNGVEGSHGALRRKVSAHGPVQLN